MKRIFSSFDYEDTRMPKALIAYQLGKNTDEFEGIIITGLDKVDRRLV